MRAPRSNASAWGQAGKQTAQSYFSIADTTRRTSPDYAGIEKAGIQTRSMEKQAAIAAESKVRRAQIAAEKTEELANIKVDLFKAKQDAKKGVRKAGMVAAAGGAIAMGLMSDEETPKPDYDVYKDYFTKAIEKDKAKLAELNSTSLQSSSSTGTDSTGGKSSDPAGKVTTAPSTGGAWKALSSVIRYGEGTTGDAGYRTQFTGTQFNDMSRHPRQIRSSGRLSSDAAGAYQFLSTTWDRAKNALGLKDFSPESQEAAGRYLTEKRGVNPDTVITNIDDFRATMDRLAPEWASLPYSGVSPGGHGRGSSYYGQGGKSLNTLWNVYQQNLGGL